MELEIKELNRKGMVARTAARKLARTSTAVKNKALSNIAEAIIELKD